MPIENNNPLNRIVYPTDNLFDTDSALAKMLLDNPYVSQESIDLLSRALNYGNTRNSWLLRAHISMKQVTDTVADTIFIEQRQAQIAYLNNNQLGD